MVWLWHICTTLGVISSLYACVAALLVRRFAGQKVMNITQAPSISLLKPLYGDEPSLYEALASFCRQDYQGAVQIIFGVQAEDDLAIAVVRRLQSDFSQLDLSLVIDARQHGANRKVSNLINMAEQARHEIIVLADSDMLVPPDYFKWLMAALLQPGVGLVTCLYRGEAIDNFWAKLGVMAIDYHFLPNVLVGLATGLAQPCFGSTIALRRETLAQIGGFQRVVDQLADDYALGAAVRELGLHIAVPPIAIAHHSSEASFAALWRHETRWARTIALVDPAGFAGSAITHAFPISILAFVFSGFSLNGAGLIVLALASRLILQINIARCFGLPRPRYWLGPLRDALSFGVFVMCFFARAVDWRGQRYVVKSDGTMKQS